MIRVLVIDDSLVSRELMTYILNSEPGIRVTGTAADGAEGLEKVKQLNPDLVTCDINMPGMDGFETTRRIMEAFPRPVLIVTGIADTGEIALSFQAIEAGALAILPRPHGIGHPAFLQEARVLIDAVRTYAEVRVIRRYPRTKGSTPVTGLYSGAKPAGTEQEGVPAAVAIGASTGGPQAIQTILAGLVKPFPVPVLAVQHIAEGFVEGLAQWLEQTTGMPVRIATQGQILQAGTVYLAQSGHHMGVARMNGGVMVTLTDHENENGVRPSVSYLFRTVVATYGPRAIGILLTGMGRDGAAELKAMKDAGCITIVQDEASSAVFGMPGEAIRNGGALYVMPPENIAETVNKLTGAAAPGSSERRRL